jgi:hypothetical protein
MSGRTALGQRLGGVHEDSDKLSIFNLHRTFISACDAAGLLCFGEFMMPTNLMRMSLLGCSW